MKKSLMALATAALAPTIVSAGGLDRTGQPVDLIFEEGNYAQASFFRINPSKAEVIPPAIESCGSVP